MKCKICGNVENNKVLKFYEKMFGTNEEHEYINCSNCGVYQLREVPEDLFKYYPKGYYSFFERVFDIFKNPIKKFFRKQRDKFACFNKGILGRFVYSRNPSECTRSLYKANVKKETKILDVGCGNGLLLYGLKEIGFQNLLGIDPFNSDDINYNNGLNILRKKITEIDGKFDVIMYHHVLEHVEKPIEELTNSRKILNKNGTIIIRIPVVPNYVFDKYGINWVDFDCPRHLYNYTIKSLKIISKQAGLKIRDFYYDSTILQFWGSEQYKKGISYYADNSYLMNRKKSIFTKNEIKQFRKKTKELNKINMGDQAVFYLESE